MDHILRTACLVKYREENEQFHLKREEWIRESPPEDFVFKLNLDAWVTTVFCSYSRCKATMA